MHHTIRSLASCGNNVVVDYLAFEEPWLPRLAGVLEGVVAYLIGVDAPLAVLEERANSRPYPAGIARGHYEIVHTHGIYDLELDTSVRSIKECGDALRDLLRRQPVPSAFKELRRCSSATPEFAEIGND